jgi:hypothetical protein
LGNDCSIGRRYSFKPFIAANSLKQQLDKLHAIASAARDRLSGQRTESSTRFQNFRKLSLWQCYWIVIAFVMALGVILLPTNLLLNDLMKKKPR